MLQEKVRLEWQKGREEADKTWRENQEVRAEVRHRDSMKVAIDAGKSNWISQVAVGVLGAIVALLAVWIGSKINPAPGVVAQPAPVVIPSPPTPQDVSH